MDRSTPKTVIKTLRRTDWPVVVKLFGDNGACGGCWCMYWRLPRGGKLWDENKGSPNRSAFQELVTSGAVHGCLALVDGEPVGWCCIGPRADFPRLERTKALATDWDEDTWSVVCFFIRSRWRHHGIATKLVRAAVDLARSKGAKRLEAYPVRSSKGGGREIPAAFAWTGVPELFEKLHFRNEKPDGGTRDIYVRRFRQTRA